MSGNSSKVPKFNGKNYAIWKTRMEVYLRSLGIEVWEAVRHEYRRPTITVTTATPPKEGSTDTPPKEGSSAAPVVIRVTSEKPSDSYDDAEKRAQLSNAKALNALIYALEDDEACRIGCFETAYDVWNALQNAYEGDESVKEHQVQALLSAFENFRMFEKEKFEAMYLRLSVIINKAAGLGHKFSDDTVVRKIARIVPREIFGARIDSMQDSTPLSRIPLMEFVGKLRAHETMVENVQAPELRKENKNISFTSRVEELSDEETDVNSQDMKIVNHQIALMSQKLKKLILQRDLMQKQSSRSSGSSSGSKGKSAARSGPQPNTGTQPKSTNIRETGCFKCKEEGHMAKDCPKDQNVKYKPKPKHANISIAWDEHYESGDDSDYEFQDQVNFVSYMASDAPNVFSDADSDNEDPNTVSAAEWKSRYEMQVSKISDYEYTVTNLRDEIADLRKQLQDERPYDPESCEFTIKGLHKEIADLSVAVLAGLDDMEALNQKLQEQEEEFQLREKVLQEQIENISESKLWSTLESLKAEFLEERQALLSKQDEMQKELDDLYKANKEQTEELAKTKKALDEASKAVSAHPSTKALDKITAIGQGVKDKRGLGFQGNAKASTSKAPPVFVKGSAKGKEVINEAKDKGKAPQEPKGKNLNNFRRIPICWTCGVKGHTYHNCWNYDYEGWCDWSYNTPTTFQNSRKQNKHDKSAKNSIKVDGTKNMNVETKKFVKSSPSPKNGMKKVKQVWIRKDMVPAIEKLSECNLSSLVSALAVIKQCSHIEMNSIADSISSVIVSHDDDTIANLKIT